MTIKKKIEKNDASLDAMQYINQGAQVRADVVEIPALGSICVRIPREFLSLVESSVRNRIGLSRNAWILEAMQEKLEREEKK